MTNKDLMSLVPMIEAIRAGNNVEVRSGDDWYELKTERSFFVSSCDWRIKPDLPPKPTQEKLDEWDRDLEDEAREPTDADEWVDQDGGSMHYRQSAHSLWLGNEHGGKRWILKERVKKPIVFDEKLKTAMLERFWRQCAVAMNTAMQQVLDNIHNQQEEAE